MKKVGIITLNGYSNYGNRLQNYALQKFIEMHGFECETIIDKGYLIQTEKNKIKKLLNKDFNQVYSKLKKIINKNKIQAINKRRENIFEDFSKTYINETDFYIEIGKIREDLEERYEYLVTGSDQIWNPFSSSVSEVSFLTFAKKYKRISYAPSFGVYDIPESERKNYKKWLSEMNYISVREEAGAKIVKDLTGRDVPVVIDPTMILTKEKWLSIAKKSKSKPNKKYILTYLLGGGNKEHKQKVKEIAKQYDLDIVNLGDIKDVEHYITGPSEFIDYINDASVFITDSFHGCVFSMLLDTPFVVCTRVGQDSKTSMESRIDTFLDKFELHDRRYSNINNINIFSCDYTKSNELLNIEREKAWDYLSRALNCDEKILQECGN
ncbi:polysaccharide pyruvyl transferase family protein [Romboutsia ilealis]|uniref:polysaccharide pyruvyl transferase family protein n=1 Tax=Romboutsia ilealis TaxID=1115758 RepID=UPI002573EBE0|nr:polysaccharide pyruvyl transferase family protein [Romboutsia ilealis]